MLRTFFFVSARKLLEESLQEDDDDDDIEDDTRFLNMEENDGDHRPNRFDALLCSSFV
jgi:hypothetical protein